jgi:hemerythrin-like domain-containing protein
MLTTIHNPRTQTARPENAVDLLLGCHDRIRHFTELALRMAEAHSAPANERAQVARAVLQYYTVALPLHEADEEESIYPRLRDALPSGVLAEANDAMLVQHLEIDSLIAELVPMWRQLEDDPSQQVEFYTELLTRTQKLQRVWTSHLQLEEERIVPAIREYITGKDLAAIQKEMRARRAM